MAGLHLDHEVDEGRPCPGDAQPVQEQAQPAAPTKEEAAEPNSSAIVTPAAGAAVEKQTSKGTRGGQGGWWSQSRQREALATRMILNHVKPSHPYKGGRGNDQRRGSWWWPRGAGWQAKR
ncbi:uncharacterized protein LOC125501359 [Athalia rosae]|uniref:uncharacterized protein LOC125501359 n=1 Tax=Athalia rosae TaxID=37344 RepID=UPI002033E9A2|nr:uncharacterized protein LOC125501359 [Athalia rosae]